MQEDPGFRHEEDRKHLREGPRVRLAVVEGGSADRTDIVTGCSGHEEVFVRVHL